MYDACMQAIQACVHTCMMHVCKLYRQRQLAAGLSTLSHRHPRTHTRKHAHMHYTCTYMYLYKYKYTHIHIHTYTHTHIHTHMRITLIYIHTYIPTYLHTHTYTQTGRGGAEAGGSRSSTGTQGRANTSRRCGGGRPRCKDLRLAVQ